MPFDKLWEGPRLRWAADDTLWLAFYCPYPNLDGFLAPLRYKRHDIPLERIEIPSDDGGLDVSWRLESTVARQWSEIAGIFVHLGHALTVYRTQATGTLTTLTGVFQNPWRPEVLEKTFILQKDAKSQLSNARLNLLIWMAEITYLMSLRPGWERELARHIPPHWLADINRSCMVDRNILRQGVFINACATSPAQWMSLLPHLFSYPGMPIYLAYGAKIPVFFEHKLFQQYAPLKTFIAYFEWLRHNPSHAPVTGMSQIAYQRWLRSQNPPPTPGAPGSPSPLDTHSSTQEELSDGHSPILDPEAPLPPEGSRQKHGQHPKDFFKDQRISLERRIAGETPAQKSLREEREFKENSLEYPTRKGPPVFVWDPIYRNNRTYWIRTICGGSMRSQLWQTTSRAMRIYHSVINEWDVWPGLDPHWSPDGDGQSEEDGEIEESLVGRIVQSRDQRNDLPRLQSSDARRRSMSPLRRTTSLGDRSRSPVSRPRPLPALLSREEMEGLYLLQLQSAADPSEDELEIDSAPAVFTYRYGLLIDPEYTPIPPQSSKINESTLGRIWSFHRVRDDIPPNWYPYLLDFTSRILERSFLPPLLSSLAPGIRHPGSFRLSAVRVINASTSPSTGPSTIPEATGMYLVEGTGLNDLPWALIIPSATTAAQILRRSWGPDKKSIAHQLLRRGISFHTMLPSTLSIDGRISSVSQDAGVHGGLGWRFPGFKPNSFDYLLYEHHCGSFLGSHSHARAALSSGGILWRLASQYLDLQLIMDGPVGDHTQQQEWDINGQKYVADSLTSSEQDLICGVYKVLNGEFSELKNAL
ncbi:hypothetical protein PHLGIDRAFT_123434 [Phlebiopsis gigantea 11061_1 CR5-6]|uniref:Uncharacterized protein n=1 Tax=Phlebiopsis gigantea (strain 11061_1 CR5-6) TaxID=745531 RepID=A0A0C3RYN2_PHLG1|nr:hypothetical protein PHLGIDRAFT_123434 [Phlebiopsis gigantea 11061_1 CR5-6]